MASPSGTSSGSTLIQNYGSEEDFQALMNQKKQKRKQSNRESARRSRMRKQKHLDDMMNQVTQLRKENNQLLTALAMTTQNYMGVEGENSVLRTQIMELSNRLQSLVQMMSYPVMASAEMYQYQYQYQLVDLPLFLPYEEVVVSGL